MKTKNACESCAYGFHGSDCMGLIRESNGDAYLCECDCLPLDEDDRARTLAEDRRDGIVLIPLVAILLAVAIAVAALS